MGDMTTIAFVSWACCFAATAAAFLLGKAWRAVSSHMGVSYATSPQPTLRSALIWYRGRTKWRVKRTILHMIT